MLTVVLSSISNSIRNKTKCKGKRLMDKKLVERMEKFDGKEKEIW